MKNNTIYKKNITILENHFPALFNKIDDTRDDHLSYRVLFTEKGIPTLEVSNKEKCILIHSKKDPWAEAQRLVKSHTDGNEQLIFVIGFGLGYHIEKLLHENKSSIIVVIEPAIKLFKEALTARDISGILLSNRVFIFPDVSHFTCEEIMSHQPHSDIKLIVLRPYMGLFNEKVAKIRNDIYSFLNKKEINFTTLKRFDRLWTKNTFKNSLYFFILSGILKLKNALNGIPAAVLCAGPSLNEDIETLVHIKDDIFLIAVDTTLKPLLKKGIIPDFAVTVDPQYINSFFIAYTKSLIKCRAPAPILVADPAVYPTTLRNYSGTRILTSSVFSPGKIIEKYSGIKGSIAAGGSVSVAAFDFARIIRADPIILLGLDLSYDKGNTHISGSFIEDYTLSSIDRFETPLNFYARYIKNGNPFQIKDKNGKIVLTDKRLLLYKSWFENHAGYGNGTVINATHGGINIEGIKNVPFKELEKDIKKGERDKKKIGKKLNDLLKKEVVDLNKIKEYRNYLNTLRQNLLILINLSNSGKALTEKLIYMKNTHRESRIKKELEEIDKKILSFQEENQLVSMVMQSSINDILNRSVRNQKKEILKNSLKLYTSIEEGTRFMLKLIGLSQKKLKKIHKVDENI